MSKTLMVCVLPLIGLLGCADSRVEELQKKLAELQAKVDAIEARKEIVLKDEGTGKQTIIKAGYIAVKNGENRVSLETTPGRASVELYSNTTNLASMIANELGGKITVKNDGLSMNVDAGKSDVTVWSGNNHPKKDKTLSVRTRDE